MELSPITIAVGGVEQDPAQSAAALRRVADLVAELQALGLRVTVSGDLSIVGRYEVPEPMPNEVQEP